MDFTLTETQDMIRDTVRSFVAGQVREPALRWNEGHGDAAGALRALADMGLLGVLAPERAGGAELDALSLAVMITELAEGDAGLAAMVAHHNAQGLGFLLRAGFTDTKALRPFAAGKQLLCLAAAEGEAHADAPDLSTRATQAGDTWRLTGAKRLVPLGNRASHAVVVAATESGARGFLVDLSGEGVTRSASAPLVGLRSCDLADLRFDDAAATHDLGPAAEALAHTRALGRLCAAAMANGVARAAQAAGVTYTLERKQFGKPIARFQPLQWQTADSATELEAAELLTWRAAWTLAQGTARSLDVEKAAIFALETVARVTDRALQMHGGYGYTVDFPVERHFRDAATLRVLADGTDVQRVALARGLAVQA